MLSIDDKEPKDFLVSLLIAMVFNAILWGWLFVLAAIGLGAG